MEIVSAEDMRWSDTSDQIGLTVRRALVRLADIERCYQTERAALNELDIPEAIKGGLKRTLEQRRSERREPYILLLAELHRQNASTAGATQAAPNSFAGFRTRAPAQPVHGAPGVGAPGLLHRHDVERNLVDDGCGAWDGDIDPLVMKSTAMGA